MVYYPDTYNQHKLPQYGDNKTMKKSIQRSQFRKTLYYNKQREGKG